MLYYIVLMFGLFLTYSIVLFYIMFYTLEENMRLYDSIT